MRLFLICLLTHITISLGAASIKYPVFEIPDSLIKEAKSVVRKNLVELKLHDLKKVSEHRVFAITVLDRSAEDHAAQVFFYDKDRSISSISATVYNALGIKTDQINKNEFNDRSSDPYGSLYSDSRLMYYSPTSLNYPFTIEYDVTYTENNSYGFPDWYPIEKYNQSLQEGKLEVHVPRGYKFSYREQGINLNPDIYLLNDMEVFSWEISNCPALEAEPYAPPFIEQAIYVKLNPSEFTYSGYDGNYNSWEEYGKFYSTLEKNRADISEELAARVIKMVEGVENPKEKAKILYKYLQDNTHYANISVGIGGIQTMPASTVEKFGYGDCKALTNYLKTLLEIAGVKSYPSLIRAGKYKYDLDTSFVHHAFNHVILYVPFEDEDVWLECTNQIVPFGFLGDNTDNRYTLIAKEEGGELKKTISYSGELSKINRTGHVQINTEGNSNARVITSYFGLDYDNVLGLLHEDYNTQEDYLYREHIDIPDFKINAFKYTDTPGQFPSAKEELDLELINYCVKSGTRVFIQANLMNRLDRINRMDGARKNPFRISREYIRNDTIFYDVPQGYSLENLPKDVKLDGKYGKFSVEYTIDSTTVKYVRQSCLYQGQYPKEEYDDFISYLRNVSKADKQKMVLVKNQ